jgi:hypothetical protein
VEAWRGRLESEGVAVEGVVTWPGGAEAFRRTSDADVAVSRLGIDASRNCGLRFAFEVVILSGVKP